MITKLFISYVLVPYIYKHELQLHLYQAISHKWVNLGITPSSPLQERNLHNGDKTTIHIHNPSILQNNKDGY